MTDIQANYDELRRQMVELITAQFREAVESDSESRPDPRVLRALERVPRHEFVPLEFRHLAYADTPLPIGFDKTISQPFIVALMTDLLAVESGQRVLEVGTGLGYQAALLAELGGEVYSVEIVEELAQEAQQRLQRLGYAQSVEIRVGDGSQGWLEHSSFERIIVTAAPELIPAPLLAQLQPGGRMVLPAGLEDDQRLMLVEKDESGLLSTQELLRVRFSTLETTHWGS